MQYIFWVRFCCNRPSKSRRGCHGCHELVHLGRTYFSWRWTSCTTLSPCCRRWWSKLSMFGNDGRSQKGKLNGQSCQETLQKAGLIKQMGWSQTPKMVMRRNVFRCFWQHDIKQSSKPKSQVLSPHFPYIAWFLFMLGRWHAAELTAEAPKWKGRGHFSRIFWVRSDGSIGHSMMIIYIIIAIYIYIL